jgi:hypothetical protein
MMAHHGFLSGRCWLAAAMIVRQSPALRSVAGLTRRRCFDQPDLSHASPCWRGLVMKAPAKLDVDFAWIVKVESAERQAVVEQDSPVRHVQRR